MKKLQTNKSRFFLLALLAVSLFSCQKNEHEDLPTAEVRDASRAMFKTTEDFIAAANKINQMSDDEVISWENRNNTSSLRKELFSKPADYEYSEQEDELLKLPKSHLSLLNKDLEVQIGDSIIWYSGGSKYYVHSDQKSLLSKIKSDQQFALSFKRHNYSTKLAPQQDPNTTTNSITVGLNHLDARYQREFLQNPPSNSCKKYVNEIRTFADVFSANDPFCGSIFTVYTTATLYIKLEWKNCSRSRWNPAGESRQISYNITNDVKLLGVVLPCSTTPAVLNTYNTISDSQVRSSDLAVLLYSWAGNSRFMPYYQIQLTGNIYQHIVGDIPGNAWNLTGNPLW